MLVFHTESEIPVGGFRLMGASTKGADDTRIGFFGTGLKYSIAVLFREGIEFGASIAGEEISFELADVEMGGETFQEILLNGQATSLTTRMGTRWEVWHAIREIWQNTVDEGGVIMMHCQPEEIPDWGTSFWIEQDDKVQAVVNRWGEYFADNFDGVRRLSHLERCPAYMKGMRVTQIGDDDDLETESLSMFSYHFTENVMLNEMRLMPDYTLEGRVYLGMSRHYSVDDWKWFLTHPEKPHTLEWELFGEKGRIPYSNEALEEALREYRIYPENYRDTVPSYPYPLKVSSTAYSVLMTRYPNLSYATEGGNYVAVECKECLYKVAKMMQEIHQLTGLELPVKLELGDFLQEETLGVYYKGTVGISHAMIHESNGGKEITDYIRSVILEELIHFNTGYDDNTRSLESYLFQMVAQALGKGTKISVPVEF